MFAVIKTGGKQYKVAKDDVIVVAQLPGEAGREVRLTDVLMLHDGSSATVGAPCVDGAAVQATVLKHGRGDKVIVFKKKRRKNYRRMKGHRQAHTVLQITDILPRAAAAPPPAAADAADQAATTGEASAPEVEVAAAPAAPEAESPTAEPTGGKRAAAKKPAESAAQAKEKTEDAPEKPAAREAAPRPKTTAKSTEE
jgi:large subunit ribosomal protein L21